MRALTTLNVGQVLRLPHSVSLTLEFVKKNYLKRFNCNWNYYWINRAQRSTEQYSCQNTEKAHCLAFPWKTLRGQCHGAVIALLSLAARFLFGSEIVYCQVFLCRGQIKCRLLLPRETQRGHHRRQSERSSGRLRPHSLLNVERLAGNIRASRRPVLLWWGWQTKKGIM